MRGNPRGAGTTPLTLTLPLGAAGRGSKQSRAQASGLLSHVPARPLPRRGCLLWEAFLDCCQAHPALCSAALRAGPLSARPSQTARPLPVISLPEEGGQGSPGPASKCPGHCQRGQQLRLQSAGARRVLTCRGPNNSHNSPGTRGHFWAEMFTWPALESASRFKIPNPEQFGQSWLQSHLEEGPGFKLRAPGPWGLPTPQQASWAHTEPGSTPGGAVEVARRKGEGREGDGCRDAGALQARGPDTEGQGGQGHEASDRGQRRDGRPGGVHAQEASPESWTCLINAALRLNMAPGTPEPRHDPCHMS